MTAHEFGAPTASDTGSGPHVRQPGRLHAIPGEAPTSHGHALAGAHTDTPARPRVEIPAEPEKVSRLTVSATRRAGKHSARVQQAPTGKAALSSAVNGLLSVLKRIEQSRPADADFHRRNLASQIEAITGQLVNNTAKPPRKPRPRRAAR
jgi:hypothetical protein